jgi:hypothetical protein
METEKLKWIRMIPDLLAFAVGLAAAYFLKWETTDLVWSLWFCSLMVGYLTILVTIGSGVYIGLNTLNNEGFGQKYRMTAILVGGGFALFLLGFFSLHFCGFHAGHSAFLSSFFPIPGISGDGFANYFMNPFKLLSNAFSTLLPLYGIFLIPTLIAERNNLMSPVLWARQVVSKERNSTGIKEFGKTGGSDSQKKMGSDLMVGPYINVIRMHLLIFFFAAAYFMKIDSFAIYAVVYAVYFFPWREFKRKKV